MKKVIDRSRESVKAREAHETKCVRKERLQKTEHNECVYVQCNEYCGSVETFRDLNGLDWGKIENLENGVYNLYM